MGFNDDFVLLRLISVQNNRIQSPIAYDSAKYDHVISVLIAIKALSGHISLDFHAVKCTLIESNDEFI
ncbi:hypothetical protein LZS97_05550 [Vibrio fluvialis]|uniref:hypothetical protein n=1 Tax=Vibrio fluvialis TaxID=676 RepID=UPI001F38418D|nr:hypothetical protein [Vibrio fluvialis]MCE7609621.1 hypothetical protein [Vibrio fluvialis]MCE7620338.1 hypothetical protein [Vibrio fluvialis]